MGNKSSIYKIESDAVDNLLKLLQRVLKILLVNTCFVIHSNRHYYQLIVISEFALVCDWQDLAGCTSSCYGQHACLFLFLGATPGNRSLLVYDWTSILFALCTILLVLRRISRRLQKFCVMCLNQFIVDYCTSLLGFLVDLLLLEHHSIHHFGISVKVLKFSFSWSYSNDCKEGPRGVSYMFTFIHSFG